MTENQDVRDDESNRPLLPPYPTALPPPSQTRLQITGRAARTAGTALVNWLRAVFIESLCIAVLWFVGLWLIHVPFAPLWALVAGLMAFIPHFGGALSLLGPVFSILVSGHDMERLAWVLGLYAVIVIIDQLVLQPWLMKRATRVPIWATLLVPIILGILIPFWGVLLAPPLLAVIYAFRKPKNA